VIIKPRYLVFLGVELALGNIDLKSDLVKEVEDFFDILNILLIVLE
jgi:hypothetical protein